MLRGLLLRNEHPFFHTKAYTVILTSYASFVSTSSSSSSSSSSSYTSSPHSLHSSFSHLSSFDPIFIHNTSYLLNFSNPLFRLPRSNTPIIHCCIAREFSSKNEFLDDDNLLDGSPDASDGEAEAKSYPGGHKTYDDSRCLTGIISRALKGIPLPPLNSRGIINVDNQLSDDVEFTLKPWHGEVDNFIFCEVLKGISKPDLAIAFFRWAQSQPEFSPNRFVYTSLMKILGDNRCLREIESLLEEIELSGCETDAIIWGQIIYAYSTYHQVRMAEKAYHRMLSLGITPDTCIYNRMVDMYYRDGQYHSAVKMFQEMKKQRLPLNTEICTTVIGAYGKLKRASEAEAVFESMKCNGPSPDHITYGYMIDILRKSGMSSRALELFREMKNIGVKPTVVTYNMILDLYRKENRSEEFLRLFEEMKESEIQPSVVTYGTYLSLLITTNDENAVEKVFSEMKSKNLHPTVVTYNIMLNGYIKNKQYAKAKMLIDEMHNLHFLPSLDTYSHLLLAYCLPAYEKDKLELWKLLEKVQEPLHGMLLLLLKDCRPNDKSFRDWENRLMSYYEALSRHPPMHRMAFTNSLLDFIFKAEKTFAATHVWENTKRFNIFQNLISTKSNMIKLDFRRLSVNAIKVGLRCEIQNMRRMIYRSKWIPEVKIIVASGSQASSQSSIHDVILNVLNKFDSPFISVNGEAAFKANGDALYKWLKSPALTKFLEFQ